MAESVVIRFARPGKPDRLFREGLVSDDGVCLHTYSIVPPEFAARWSHSYQEQGLIPAGRRIAAAEKHLFYAKGFAVLELQDSQGAALGWYMDICSPLRREAGEYLVTDLFLDVWLWPDGRWQVFDQDEFDTALEGGLLDANQAQAARATLAQLQVEIGTGRFLQTHLGKNA
jgi:hypothetical protein